jgi:hypothetical protein
MKTQTNETIISDMDLLKQIVEERFNKKIISKGRYRENVDARMVFSKILRERGHTYKSIGQYLYKDHSTIIHYIEQAPNIFKTDKKLMDFYIECRNKFLENREPIVLHTDRDLVREVLSLRNQIDDLISQYEAIKEIEKKYERLNGIINLINLRTPVGSENLIKRKINEMFNE